MRCSLFRRCAAASSTTGGAASQRAASTTPTSTTTTTTTAAPPASVAATHGLAGERVTHPSDMLIQRDRPFALVHREVVALRAHITSLVANKNNAILDRAAAYAVAAPGKLLRPSLVCLMGYATMDPALAAELQRADLGDLDDVAARRLSFRRHVRLAEVTELIHTASLIHDDVIDESAKRRGRDALHVATGSTKTAVLAGDFMLARASYWIGTLDCNPVVLHMTRALEDLIQGEIMQDAGCFDVEAYMAKSYCKTASLIERSLCSAAILSCEMSAAAGGGGSSSSSSGSTSGCGSGSDAAAAPSAAQQQQRDAYVAAASEFGHCLGIAFQIVDDCLDLTGSESTMGKPKLGDLKEGIATLPILLAATHESEVDAAVRRKFAGGEADIQRAIAAMEAHNTVTTALQMADDLCRAAISALDVLPPSDARAALQKAAGVVLNRQL